MHMEHKLIGGKRLEVAAAGILAAQIRGRGGTRHTTAQVNTLADGWEARNVPATDRVVNIVVSEVEAGPRP